MEPLFSIAVLVVVALVVLARTPDRFTSRVRRFNADNIALWEAHTRVQRPWQFSGPEGARVMWHVHCAECGHEVLVGAAQIERLVNLAPGVIAIEVHCSAGHRVEMLAGSATRR